MAPAVVGDYLYVGSCAGVFYAFSAASGEVRWTFSVAGDGATQFHGNPLIRDTVVYFGADSGIRGKKGWLYALNRLTGSLLWKLPVDLGLPSAPRAGDSLLYLVPYSGQLTAVNAESGEPAWVFANWSDSDSLPASERSARKVRRRKTSPLLYEDLVIFDGPDTAVHCVAAELGGQVWSRKLERKIISQLCLVETSVAFSTVDSCMVYLDAATGDVKRVDTLGIIPLYSMLYQDGLLLFLGSNRPATPRYLAAIDPLTGEFRWRISLEDPDRDAYWYAPRVVVWKGDAIVGSTNGLLAAYRVSDGSMAWSYQLGGRIRGIGFSDDMLYVGTYAGMLYALRW